MLLLVNTASKCGLTPQYKALEEIYKRYKDQGLVILGFPANDFLGQEPGTNQEIKDFCLINYGVSFPMFAKISVRGKDIHPLYKFLVEKETNPHFAGKISWNFTKFLVDRKGDVIARFEPQTGPRRSRRDRRHRESRFRRNSRPSGRARPAPRRSRPPVPPWPPQPVGAFLVGGQARPGNRP